MSNEEIVEQIQKGIEVTLNQERLWMQNKAFVDITIKDLCGFDDDFEDYEQQGFIGLLTAAMKYNPASGANFLTFAAYHIRAAIFRYNENCCHSIRTPVYIRQRIRKYMQFRQQALNDKGAEPSQAEYMEQLHIGKRALRTLEKTMYNMRAVSVDAPLSESDTGASLLDMLQSDENIEELITHSVYHQELKKALDEAMDILDQDTRVMMQMKYYQRYSAETIAKMFGCSVQNVFDRIGTGFWKVLHSKHRKNLESFMWEGYQYNECRHSQYAELAPEDINNEFLV